VRPPRPGGGSRHPYGMSKLLLAVVVLLSSEVAFAGKPVVLDFYGKPDTLVLTRTVTKEGSPWGWVAELSVFVKVDKTESDDVLVVQHHEGSKKWGAAQKCSLGNFDELDHVAEF